jgi:hypothetical protein
MSQPNPNMRWVPYFNGILHSSGSAFEFVEGRLEPCSRPQEVPKCVFYVNATSELFGGFRLKCGESSDGSVGVIVLEDAKSERMIWSLVSDDSNPFDQIADKGAYVLVLSTSGSVFRFQTELENAELLIS